MMTASMRKVQNSSRPDRLALARQEEALNKFLTTASRPMRAWMKRALL